MVLRVGVLDGKVAIVTGTSRGVGVGIAHELLRAGATVIGCSRSRLDALPGTDSEPDWANRSVQMTCDQGDYCAIDALVSEVAATYGRIDILVTTPAARCLPRTSRTCPRSFSRFRVRRAATTTSSARCCFTSILTRVLANRDLLVLDKGIT
jgi:NAD(P)-dependent dehydrogenase (short-subunit alcohol dehydrogenase family)